MREGLLIPLCRFRIRTHEGECAAEEACLWARSREGEAPAEP